MNPDSEQALQFCLMLQAGLPAVEAIRYFTDSTDSGEVADLLRRWKRSASVQKAWNKLQGKSWLDLTLHEKMQKGLDMVYAGMAFHLFNTNYAEANQVEKAKLDTARQAIEQKLAGNAGAGDPFSMFMADMKAGKWSAMISASKPKQAS